MHLECKNKYFQYGPKSRLISALLYVYKNKIVYDETLPSWRVVYCVSALPSPYAGQYAYVHVLSLFLHTMLLLTELEVHRSKYLF